MLCSILGKREKQKHEAQSLKSNTEVDSNDNFDPEEEKE